MLTWLEKHLEQPIEVWNLLNIRAADREVTLGSARYEINDALASEYMLRLVDGVLAKAAKQPEGNS
ncbi:MAG: hypothetical protein F6K39_41790 [Okeania sp. SIO3B3]|nr:hypothetical protein [Okeania sp. SIO3B3]